VIVTVSLEALDGLARHHTHTRTTRLWRIVSTGELLRGLLHALAKPVVALGFRIKFRLGRRGARPSRRRPADRLGFAPGRARRSARQPRSYQPVPRRIGQAETDERKIERLISLVERTAARTIAELVEACRRLGLNRGVPPSCERAQPDPRRSESPTCGFTRSRAVVPRRGGRRALRQRGYAHRHARGGALVRCGERTGDRPDHLKGRMAELGRGGSAGGWRRGTKDRCSRGVMLLSTAAGRPRPLTSRD